MLNINKIGTDSENKVYNKYLSQGYYGGRVVKKEPYKYRTIRFKSKFNMDIILEILKKYVGSSDDKKRQFLSMVCNSYVSCKGYPDYIFLSPNNIEILFVEVKTDTSKMTIEQKEIKKLLENNGFRVELEQIDNVFIYPKDADD